MSKKAHVNITLDESVLRWIDMDRGQEPRSSFINHVLARLFKKHQQLFDWAKEDQLAEEDIKGGRVKKFADKKKAIQWLKS